MLSLKECLRGAWHWPRYRFATRCWSCGRLMCFHTPWAAYICSRTNPALSFTEKGLAVSMAA